MLNPRTQRLLNVFLMMLCVVGVSACSALNSDNTSQPTTEPPQKTVPAVTAEQIQSDLEKQRAIGTLIGTYTGLLEQGNANFAALARCGELRLLDPTWLGPLQDLWQARNQSAQRALAQVFEQRWAEHELDAVMEQRMRNLLHEFQQQLRQRYIREARAQVNRLKSAQRSAQCQKVYADMLNGERDLQQHPIYRSWVFNHG